jgi:hypothetical protein
MRMGFFHLPYSRTSFGHIKILFIITII